MRAQRRVRLARAVVVATLGLGAVTLTSCSSGTSSGALEHEACADVHRSLADFARASRETGAAASRDRTHAAAQLAAAVAPAAIASAADSDYQALTATLSEISHVPEGELVTALTAQCAAVLGST